MPLRPLILSGFDLCEILTCFSSAQLFVWWTVSDFPHVVSTEMSRALTLQQLLQVTGDAVAGVLDLYRQHYASRLAYQRPLILEDVKLLFSKIQQYEQQILTLDCGTMGIAISPLQSTHGLLDHCLVMGKHLQLQIKQSVLNDDIETRHDIQALSEAISQLIVQDINKGHRHEHGPPRSSAPFAERPERSRVPPIRSPTPDRSSCVYAPGLTTAEAEARDELAIMRKQNNELRACLEELEASDQSKLSHVKLLHTAISSLNVRHLIPHRSSTWKELTDELPRLLDHLSATNELLKEFERLPASPIQSTIPTNTFSDLAFEPMSPIRGSETNEDFQPTNRASFPPKAGPSRWTTGSLAANTRPDKLNQSERTGVTAENFPPNRPSSATESHITNISSSTAVSNLSSQGKAADESRSKQHRRSQSHSQSQSQQSQGMKNEKRKSGRSFWNS